VLVLLTVCDGFVNDIEVPRRGLHARSADEMAAWDSVVGHHMGLSHAHSTFVKGFYKTSDEEVTELYRNGIVHGMLTNYGNVIVATKAWNRLFAVADWARSRERAGVEPPPKPTWLETLKQIGDLAAARRAIDAFQPVTLSAGEPGFGDHPFVEKANRFLSVLAAGNYGAMVPFASASIGGSSTNETAGILRRTFGHLARTPSTLAGIDWRATGLCEIDFEVGSSTGPHRCRMRWRWEDEAGKPVSPPAPGEWRLVSITPTT
jgi:hypothetical protein